MKPPGYKAPQPPFPRPGASSMSASLPCPALSGPAPTLNAEGKPEHSVNNEHDLHNYLIDPTGANISH